MITIEELQTHATAWMNSTNTVLRKEVKIWKMKIIIFVSGGASLYIKSNQNVFKEQLDLGRIKSKKGREENQPLKRSLRLVSQWQEPQMITDIINKSVNC